MANFCHSNADILTPPKLKNHPSKETASPINGGRKMEALSQKFLAEFFEPNESVKFALLIKP